VVRHETSDGILHLFSLLTTQSFSRSRCSLRKMSTMRMF
jgi:hypothetical protein